MLDIPIKILEEIKNDPKNVWIERYDRLQSLSGYTILDNENQYKLWKTNCAIRKAFSEIEKEITVKRKTSSKISERLVGWSEIARKAHCDRNTLKHPIRQSWVKEQREKLLHAIKAPMEEYSLRVVKTPEEELKSELEKTKSALKKSESETGKWFLKYNETLDELRISKEALKRQMEINRNMDNRMNDLKVQLKELMK